MTAPALTASQYKGVTQPGTSPRHQRKAVANAEAYTDKHHGHDNPSFVADPFGGTFRNLSNINAGPCSFETIKEMRKTASTDKIR